MPLIGKTSGSFAPPKFYPNMNRRHRSFVHHRYAVVYKPDPKQPKHICRTAQLPMQVDLESRAIFLRNSVPFKFTSKLKV